MCGSKRKCKTNENWQKTRLKCTPSPCIWNWIGFGFLCRVCARCSCPNTQAHTRDTAFARDSQNPSHSSEHVSLVPKNEMENWRRCRPTVYVTTLPIGTRISRRNKCIKLYRKLMLTHSAVSARTQRRLWPWWGRGNSPQCGRYDRTNKSKNSNSHVWCSVVVVVVAGGDCYTFRTPHRR